MRTLWRLSGLLTEPTVKGSRCRCFRILNCIVAGLFGLILWLIVRLFALDSPDWMICFIGYPVVVHGLFGSTLYINAHNDSEE